MILRIMNAHNGLQPFTSKWIDVEPEMKGKNKKAVSLQVSWKNLSGPLSGEILVLGSNDREDAGYRKVYQINTDNNFNDSELIILRRYFKYLRIIYVPLGITGGQIFAHLYYK